jgi:hypothetical protein
MKKNTYFQPLGGSLSQILDPLMIKKSHIETSLALYWPEIIGEKYAQSSRPLTVTWPRAYTPHTQFQSGCLTIASENSAILELQHQTPQLIEKINKYFGYCVINSIKIKQTSLEKFKNRPVKTAPKISLEQEKSVKKIVDLIENEDLKKSLQQLGLNIVSSDR